MADKQSIIYKLDNNIFIPYSTGVIVWENKRGDAYNETTNEYLIKEIENFGQGDARSFLNTFDGITSHSYNYNFLDDGEHTVYRFFYVECQKDMYAVFMFSSGTPVKLWINQRLYSIFGSHKRFCIVGLKKGLNCVIMETYRTTKKSTFFLRISDYDLENKKVHFDSVFCDNMYPSREFGCVKHSGTHLYGVQKSFEFAFYPEDDMHSSDDYGNLHISDSYRNTTYYTCNFEVRKKQNVDLSGVLLENEDDGNTLCATITYKYSNGYIYTKTIPLYLKKTDERIKRLSERANKMIESSTLTEYDKLAIRQGYEYINLYGRELSAILAQASSLRKNMQYIQDGHHLDDTIYAPGVKRIFFYNAMYDAVNYYWMYVPENYSNTREYPLVVIFSTLEHNDRSKCFKYYTDEDVLAVDVSMRGMTLGSYIGEAAIQIAINDICKKFNVNMNRIYCTGISNGAGGVWAQLENYPDRYSGGCAVSGYSNLEYLCNTRNLKLVMLSSEADYLNNIAFDMPMSFLRDSKNCVSIIANMLTHQLLEYAWFKKKLFKLLLETNRDAYPKKITYKTMSNRHNKAYWVEIHSIEYGQIEGKIEAEINHKTINVKCEGISGFTIYTPPQIKDQDFNVIINEKKEICFTKNTEDKLCFIKDMTDGSNEFIYMEIGCYKRELRKGFGLLDVYFDPLSIVKPVDATNNEQNTAVAYSEPYCYGSIPKIYIKYPILDYNEMEEKCDKTNRSYVVLDNGEDNSLLSLIREKAIVVCEKSGWKYKGEEHNGQYCIQQIVESPWDPEKSIHLISYNDESMLYKNIFTRKLVIPSYVNGRHKYLNNMALIFDKNGYSGIIDNTCDIDKL